MQRAGSRTTACEDEATERGQFGLQSIDPLLETRDIFGGNSRFRDAISDAARRIRKARAQSEEVPLDLLEHPGDVFVCGAGAEKSKPRVQFIHVAVRRHTRIGLRHARAIEQRRVAAVAGPGVDFHADDYRRFVHAAAEVSLGSSRYVSRRRAALAPPLPPRAARQQFRRRLLQWYRRNGRDLPWRRTTDPYRILVSEVMLQQTQVERVLPKYEEWLARYPTLQALAGAPEHEVAETWRPLGYNVRPRRLHAIARESVANYGGMLPSDEQTLRSFKGIGEYTAGAVLSFAFGKRAAILDTNVARVLFRVFVGRGNPKAHTMRRHLWEVSRTVLPRRHVFDFNQALMDFGATLCTARKPGCLLCPMQRDCAAYPYNPENERA